MKKQLILNLFLVLLITGMSACKKEKEITCSLSAATSQPSVGMDVKYTATSTGDGTIASVSYVGETGLITVSNPTLPWTITVYVPAGTSVSVSATGTVKNGSLTVDYSGSSGGSNIYGSDFCSHETN